jgi:hypothetical protein
MPNKICGMTIEHLSKFFNWLILISVLIVQNQENMSTLSSIRKGKYRGKEESHKCPSNADNFLLLFFEIESYPH